MKRLIPLFTLLIIITTTFTLRVYRGDRIPPPDNHPHHHHSAHQVKQDTDDFETELRARLLQSSTSTTDIISLLAQIPDDGNAITFSTMNPNDKEFFGAIQSYMGISLEFDD